jgi:hypothetical protein
VLAAGTHHIRRRCTPHAGSRPGAFKGGKGEYKGSSCALLLLLSGLWEGLLAELWTNAAGGCMQGNLLLRLLDGLALVTKTLPVVCMGPQGLRPFMNTIYSQHL